MLLFNRYFIKTTRLCIIKTYRECCSFLDYCRSYCFCRNCFLSYDINECPADIKCGRFLFVIATLLIFIIYFVINIMKLCEANITVFCNESISNITENTYKYKLFDDSEVTMDHEKINNVQTSYTWFVAWKHLFKNLGQDEALSYPEGTPICKINMSSLGPITVSKTVLNIDWVENVHSDVKLGGFYAPTHCQSRYRVAIFVPFRNRQKNLVIFLYYIHRLLKKHLLEYRIFIIEQFGSDPFNRGKLFNIAFLESQRFGTWDCLIFHDVDTIPEDDRIIYTCSHSPFHFASAIEQHGYNLRYEEEFGGVTGLTPTQFEAINGYSNFYWNWGGEDDDISARLKFMNFNISRYDASIVRFATLPHQHNVEKGPARTLFLLLCKQRFEKEGLRTTDYNLIAVDKKKLYTHIIADVNPEKLKLDQKNLLRQMVLLSGTDVSGCRRTFLIHKATKKTSPSITPPILGNYNTY